MSAGASARSCRERLDMIGAASEGSANRRDRPERLDVAQRQATNAMPLRGDGRDDHADRHTAPADEHADPDTVKDGMEGGHARRSDKRAAIMTIAIGTQITAKATANTILATRRWRMRRSARAWPIATAPITGAPERLARRRSGCRWRGRAMRSYASRRR